MKIDFNESESVSIEHFYGGEGTTDACMNVDEAGNRILKGRLAPGCSIGLHRHEKSMEAIFILSGTGKAICDGREERLSPGDCHFCPEGSEHSLINDGIGDLTFFAMVPKLG